MVGLCPQSLIVKTGGLDAGHCADVNFTVADGTVDQKCGPCGTVTFNKFKQASVLSSADDCANFRKVSAGECAEACVPSMVGLCPQSLIVKTGGLDAGHCADVNFTVADGTVDQKCGPCGTVTFNKFKQASVLSADGSIDLVTFDGAKATTHEWEAVNDPVMGGQSVSTFTVQKGAGVFDGEVKIVPFLHAAGFCNAETKGTQSFTDISSTDGIAFTMRNTGNLTGLQATVTTQGSGTGLKHGSYMGNFVVPNDGKTHTVAVKWADFSCEWRGQKIKCPTMQSQLGKVTQIGMSFGQAPNVPGTFHVELLKVSGVKL